jgi:hypothetical protein
MCTECIVCVPCPCWLKALEIVIIGDQSPSARTKLCVTALPLGLSRTLTYPRWYRPPLHPATTGAEFGDQRRKVFRRVKPIRGQSPLYTSAGSEGSDTIPVSVPDTWKNGKVYPSNPNEPSIGYQPYSVGTTVSTGYV